MKKSVHIYLAIAMAAILSGCEKYSKFNITEKPYVNASSVNLYIGEYAGDRNRFQMICSPTNRQYTWTSDNPDVATVDQNGLITAHNEGFAIVTVASENDFTQASLTVKKYVPLTGFTLDRSAYTGKMQDITYIQVLPIPENASEVTVQWTSSNEKVAQVFENGMVKVVGLGKSVITASAVGVTRTVTVTNNVFPITSETLPGYSASSNLGTIGYSSQNLPSYGILNLFDGNIATFWHGNYQVQPFSNYPHWFILDLRKAYAITDIMMQKRQEGTGQNFKSLTGFYLYTCPDVTVDKNDPVNGYPWELNKEYTFNSLTNNEQWYSITERPRARYIKIFIDTKHKDPAAANNYIQLAEFRLLVDE